MVPFDYAFTKMYNYDVDRNVYNKHRFYEYNNYKGVKSLLKLLRRMVAFNDPPAEAVWGVVVRNNSKPTTRIEVRDYEDPCDRTIVDFLVDTGSDVSMLTADTADDIGVDRYLGDDDPIIVTGIGGKGVVGIPRWIYILFGGMLHPIPVLVPPIDETGSEINNIPLVRNILGRAVITSCFLLCFDNKRLYAFPRLASEPLK